MATSSNPHTSKRMGGRVSDISLSLIIVTLPMLLFATLLLGFVFHYRVTQSSTPFQPLQTPGTASAKESGVYYVKLNATLLVFIASWSSTVAPMLASFLLALAAYPICHEYLYQAQATDRGHQLPTPYQLALTLRFLNGGGFGALWSWIRYLAGWKNDRKEQASLLKNTAIVSIGATILGHVDLLLSDEKCANGEVVVWYFWQIRGFM